MFIRRLVILLLCTLSASCASTSLVDSWKSDDLQGSYQRPMIIGISDSQQTRRLYEKYFVSSLKEKDIAAIPSYTLIDSKQKINRESVVAAIKGTDIDSVLVTYRVADNAEFKHDISIVSPGSKGQDETNHISDTIVTKRGYSRSNEIFMLKTDMYAVDTRSLVWSAQTESVGPGSVDQVIREVTEILIKELFDDDLLSQESLGEEILKHLNIK